MDGKHKPAAGKGDHIKSSKSEFAYTIAATKRSEQRKLTQFVRMVDFMICNTLSGTLLESLSDVLGAVRGAREDYECNNPPPGGEDAEGGAKASSEEGDELAGEAAAAGEGAAADAAAAGGAAATGGDGAQAGGGADASTAPAAAAAAEGDDGAAADASAEASAAKRRLGRVCKPSSALSRRSSGYTAQSTYRRRKCSRLSLSRAWS